MPNERSSTMTPAARSVVLTGGRGHDDIDDEVTSGLCKACEMSGTE